MSSASPSSLMQAVQAFDAAEANLVKLERLWALIEPMLPSGLSYDGATAAFDNARRAFEHILSSLPAIDSWRPEIELPDPASVFQARFDAQEIGEIGALITVDEWVAAPGGALREYRFRLNQKRRQLTRAAMEEVVNFIDGDLRRLAAETDFDASGEVEQEQLVAMREYVAQVDTLLGSSPRPPRWGDLRRHLHFGHRGDIHDIVHFDWPAARKALSEAIYEDDEPLPVPVADLGELVAQKPRGAVSTKLNWKALSDEGFERLMFNLLNTTSGYENPTWLTATRAADRGRDLEVYRVILDPLAGTRRERIIVQCKHWTISSIAVAEVTKLQGQMELWSDPPVDVLVISTTGRFTADAVAYIEKHNVKGVRPRIEMWPESRLEMFLSGHPDLIAEAGLRGE